MAYQKHTWVHNETITAANLNHIEEGIFNNDKAIREAIAPVVLTETLAAGDTTVTFTDESIATATSLHLRTSSGIAPIAQSISGSTFTAVFEVQEADLIVSVEVK